MIPELAHFSLMLATCFAALGFVVPLVGLYKRDSLLVRFSLPLTYLVGAAVLIAFVGLCYSFSVDDFSVLYVADNSSRSLPFGFKISAVWGGHEGSLLLWGLILSGWSCCVAYRSRHLREDVRGIVLAVLSLISLGFLSFLLFTSSPFIRLLPNVPQSGGDLNPLLQDFGLIIHPPMLYMGYVGFAVPFAFAIAALVTGEMNAQWARWVRPWVNFAWAFLTVGIALGSWWAYYELGWGGWWFWDPVENASFMPWLAGTALIHSLAASEKRGVFKSWTLLLAIFTFGLSFLGTFLVRSGVLTSVHAFASDPSRGAYILTMLLLIVGGGMLLFALRASTLRTESFFEFSGKESWLLLNNILLTTLTLIVLVGTLSPLVLESMGMGRVSVGPPYFNAVFNPIACALIFLIGIGPISRWQATSPLYLLRVSWFPFVLAVAIASFCFQFLVFDLFAFLAFSIALWVVIMTIRDLIGKVIVKDINVFERMRRLPMSLYGMHVAHLGVAISLIGVILVSLNSEERFVRWHIGESVDVKQYQFMLMDVGVKRGANYIAQEAVFQVSDNNVALGEMIPEKRYYQTRGQVMTEAALSPGFTRDLYIALGEKYDDDSWSVKIYVKSFVRWIWLGALVMMLGGILAALDKRFKHRGVAV
ncbi:heme lyase CcmF/NrfE family subunit [Marinomonas mediterranea]|jgi:c-type cytochrome biogenesis protein CcmF|uniref:Cytochrome c-type biogenesis protein CcmF n=1 Tax=Marinomonas mediterranea (strain ATCC 700492 / JCM 21426 / NBRC 103028 / MMB-1) TaxID=717774 RepID=F2K3H8_MARM1|nr:heme lyase CcmF/NrfE family subunit [Marinomonas mediterranea]ADZ92417.1 cytochrome c-type biogenesis protein CcmF [Marinomonas mediterranea MMB-1]WCN18466.1 heme lyase CcmF/NrfE family subunit [Marinomonas mediterranea MMB-1]